MYVFLWALGLDLDVALNSATQALLTQRSVRGLQPISSRSSCFRCLCSTAVASLLGSCLRSGKRFGQRGDRHEEPGIHAQFLAKKAMQQLVGIGALLNAQATAQAVYMQGLARLLPKVCHDAMQQAKFG